VVLGYAVELFALICFEAGFENATEFDERDPTPLNCFASSFLSVLALLG
jgi:hypothetical protein